MKDERYDYIEYYNKLSDEEKKFIRQFYREYYFDGVSTTKENAIIKDPDMLKEARRNHNSMKTEALFRAKKDGVLSELTPRDEVFMNDASDEWDWELVYKQQGHLEAVEFITKIAKEEINAGVDIETVLLRYYEKRDRLRRMINRDKRK